MKKNIKLKRNKFKFLVDIDCINLYHSLHTWKLKFYAETTTIQRCARRYKPLCTLSDLLIL